MAVPHMSELSSAEALTEAELEEIKFEVDRHGKLRALYANRLLAEVTRLKADRNAVLEAAAEVADDGVKYDDTPRYIAAKIRILKEEL